MSTLCMSLQRLGVLECCGGQRKAGQLQFCIKMSSALAVSVREKFIGEC